MAPRKAIMAKLSAVFFVLLLHLGCFIIFTGKRRRQSQDQNEDDDDDTIRSTMKANKLVSFLKGIFAAAKHYSCKSGAVQTHPSTPPRSSSQHSAAEANPRKRPSLTDSEIHDGAGELFFPLRNDIFPCTLCGEIFQKPQALEAHQGVKHAVSELHDGDSGKNIVQIIFKSGWGNKKKSPTIHRILKIHNGSKSLSRFEEYREAVKAKAARYGGGGGGRRRDERCIADGNEVLRFHCSTFVCELGEGGSSAVCGHQYCSICGVIKSGFSAKLDGIPTLSSSWKAHVAVPDEVEEEFAFMNVRRAMLVCRVVAGRVGSEADDDGDHAKDGGGFDSVLGRAGCGAHSRVDEEELLVFNPRAVLPCFVIVYTVSE